MQQIGPGGTTSVLIDSSPDMREQLLAVGVNHIDAVLYTHAHADHLHGIDDLRAFWMRTRRLVEVYADASTAMRIMEAFGYCFQTPVGGTYPPTLRLNPIVAYQPIRIDGAGGTMEIVPYQQVHGSIGTLGFKVGQLAYSCDVSALDDKAKAVIEDCEVWIVDALRREPHPSHFRLEETLSWIARLGVKRGISPTWTTASTTTCCGPNCQGMWSRPMMGWSLRSRTVADSVPASDAIMFHNISYATHSCAAGRMKETTP